MTAAIRAVLVDRHQNRKFLYLALVGCEHANTGNIALASGFCVLFFFFRQGSATGQTRPHLTFSTRPDEKAWELRCAWRDALKTAQPRRAVHLYQRHHSVFDDEHASKRCASLSS